MVERQEVDALLAEAERGERPITDSRTMAALCRAWLAVQDAPEGYALMGRGDWIEVFNLSADDRHAVEGQRVRIVKEGE